MKLPVQLAQGFDKYGNYYGPMTEELLLLLQGKVVVTSGGVGDKPFYVMMESLTPQMLLSYDRLIADHYKVDYLFLGMNSTDSMEIINQKLRDAGESERKCPSQDDRATAFMLAAQKASDMLGIPVIVCTFDEETPRPLYKRLADSGCSFSHIKGGYGVPRDGDPEIIVDLPGAESALPGHAYGHDFPGKTKPYAQIVTDDIAPEHRAEVTVISFSGLRRPNGEFYWPGFDKHTQ